MKLKFTPELRNENGDIVPKKFVVDNIEAIGDWYDKRFDKEYENEFGFKINEIGYKDDLVIDLDVTDDEIFHKSYVFDPDDDGNYPLKIGNGVYFISYREPINIVKKSHLNPSMAFFKIKSRELRTENMKASQLSKIIKNLWKNLSPSEQSNYEGYQTNHQF